MSWLPMVLALQLRGCGLSTWMVCPPQVELECGVEQPAAMQWTRYQYTQ